MASGGTVLQDKSRVNPQPTVDGATDTPINHVFSLSRDRFQKQVLLTLQLTYTTGGTPPTLNADDILNFIRSIQVNGSSGTAIKTYTGPVLGKSSKYLAGTSVQRSVPLTASSTVTATLTLPIRFPPIDAAMADRCLLNATKFDSLQVQVNLGILSDIFASNVPTKVSAVLQLTDIQKSFPNQALEYLNVETMAQIPAVVQNSTIVFEYDRRTLIRLMAFEMKTPAGVLSDAIVSQIALYVNGDQLIRTINYAELQAMNKEMFSLESLEPGFTIWHFDPTRLMKNMLDVRSAREFQIYLYTLGFGAGSAVVNVLFQEMMPLPT